VLARGERLDICALDILLHAERLAQRDEFWRAEMMMPARMRASFSSTLLEANAAMNSESGTTMWGGC